MDYYKANSPEEEELVIYLRENQLVHDNTTLQLSDTQTASIKTICEKFDYLRVCKEAVFFCEDETGYYGLVYSKHPLLALYKAELPQNGRDFHRINNRWYEWGVFAG